MKQNFLPIKRALLSFSAATLCLPTIAHADRKDGQKTANSLIIKGRASDGTWHWISSRGRQGSRVIWVGQKVELAVRFSNGADVEEPEWDIPSEHFVNYTEGNSSQITKISPTDLKKDRVLFRWCDRLEGSVANRVKATGKALNNSTHNQYVSYRVRKPQVTVTTQFHMGTIGKGKVFVLNNEFNDGRYGLFHPGIYLTGEKIGGTWPSDGTQLKWVQVIKNYQNRYYEGDGTPATGTTPNLLTPATEVNALDFSNPYPQSWVKGDDDNKVGNPLKLDKKDAYFEDRPGVAVTYGYLSHFRKVKTAHSFEAYLMFKMSNGAWVPLVKVPWSWSGEANVIDTIGGPDGAAGKALVLVPGAYLSSPVVESTNSADDFPHWTYIRTH